MARAVRSSSQERLSCDGERVRLEAVVRDEMDPATFMRTLAAASVRSGFRITRSG